MSQKQYNNDRIEDEKHKLFVKCVLYEYFQETLKTLQTA